MDEIIKIEHVTKRFTGHTALDDVSIDIPRGGVYGMLGPNGAGKTTLIRIINHITAPDSGKVIFDGHPLTSADTASIGYLPEERGLYKKMKVGDQALFFARLKGLSKTEARRRLKEWFERLDISDWWDRKVEELSKGMAQKVQFVVTVLHRPPLLIFDEPFSGFDPINAEVLKREILRLRDEGTSIIFSTHNMASVEEICDNITLINKGHNILTGNVAEIRRRYSDGCYTFTYTGDDNAVTERLKEIATDMERSVGDDGITTLSLKLRDGDTGRKEVISMLNSTVDLLSVNRRMASMNDIFINFVNNSTR